MPPNTAMMRLFFMSLVLYALFTLAKAEDPSQKFICGNHCNGDVEYGVISNFGVSIKESIDKIGESATKFMCDNN